MSVLDTLITDRTAEDVRQKNARGTYNADDLNRVSAAVAELREVFRTFGYLVSEEELREWAVNELPRLSEAEAFLGAVLDLDGRFVYSSEMIALPVTMRMLTYTGANNIEKFLAAMPEVFERMTSAWYYADEIYTGEV